MNVSPEIIQAALNLIVIVEANGLNTVESAQAYIAFRTRVVGARLAHELQNYFDGAVAAH
jgi:ethanolamine ammonia-lyase small subunit